MIRMLIAMLAFASSAASAADIPLPPDLKDRFPSAQVQVIEPHEHQSATFEAVALEPVLDQIAPGWTKQESIVFHCLDGYQATVPVIEILKNSGRGYIAYDRIYGPGEKNQGFTILREGADQRTDLGPYYLVWERAQHPAKDQVSINYWPYQATSIEPQ